MEQRLVEATLRGEPQAFGILVSRYQRPLFNLMVRLTGSRDEAADLAQDAFVRAYEKLDSFRLERRFFPWLYAIGMNVARDWLRRRAASGLTYMEENDLEAMAGRGAETQDLAGEVLDAEAAGKAVQALPLEYREAILLRYREDLSMQEIAAALGISVSGAKMRVHRGLDMVRRMLGCMPAKEA